MDIAKAWLSVVIVLLVVFILSSCSWDSKNVKVLSQVRKGEVLQIKAENMQCVAVRYKETLVLRCVQIPGD